MNRLMTLLLAVGLAVATHAGTAEAQVRGPLSAGGSHPTKGRTLAPSSARAAAPKARNEKPTKGRALSGAKPANSAAPKRR